MTESPTSMSHASDEEDEDNKEETDKSPMTNGDGYGVTKSPKTNGHGSGVAAEEDEEEEEDDESEEEDDDDEEEEEEPALKYDRITGSIPDLFKKDSASALSVSNNFMVCCICAKWVKSDEMPRLSECILGSSTFSTCLENGSSRSSPTSPLFSISSLTLPPNGSRRHLWTVRLLSGALPSY